MWSTSSHWVSSSIGFSVIPTDKHTQSWWVRGCGHLPLSHHNTLFKLDTARSLFFLADLTEPVQSDLPYQSVKGIFHSLQYKTQLSSMLRNAWGHPVWVHVLHTTDTQERKQTASLWFLIKMSALPCLLWTLTLQILLVWLNTEHPNWAGLKRICFPPLKEAGLGMGTLPKFS